MSHAIVSSAQSRADEPPLFNHTYLWLFLGLGLTTVISIAMVTLPLVSNIVLGAIAPNVGEFVWLIVLQLLLVGYLAPPLPLRPASATGSAFLGLAVLNGLIFSFVLTYTGKSIGETYLFTLYDGLFGGGWLWEHIGTTLKVVLFGFLLAAALGVPLGIALGSTRGRHQMWKAAIQTMYAVPETMIYPGIIVLFGVGVASRITIAFSHAVFPLVIGAMTGAAARSPSMAPALATPVRTGLSLSVIGVVLSEMYVSNKGLGFLLTVSVGARGSANRVLAIILLLFLVLLLVNVGLWALEKLLRVRAETD